MSGIKPEEQPSRGTIPMNYGLTKTRVRLASGAAVLALSAGAAMAQEAVEQVVVSSTRLQAAGFDAPTPTTVVSAADIQAQAKPSIFEAITQLPALQGSTGEGYNTGSTTTGLIGLQALGLRGLSPLRTLVLLDSQRVVGGNFNGVVDVSQMPQMLIQRVDVVTGGASASWGSDAVAGVINFVTDKKFEGFKFNAQAGLSTYGDAANMLFQVRRADDRGRSGGVEACALQPGRRHDDLFDTFLRHGGPGAQRQNGRATGKARACLGQTTIHRNSPPGRLFYRQNAELRGLDSRGAGAYRAKFGQEMHLRNRKSHNCNAECCDAA